MQLSAFEPGMCFLTKMVLHPETIVVRVTEQVSFCAWRVFFCISLPFYEFDLNLLICCFLLNFKLSA
jgi:hypothetical protein